MLFNKISNLVYGSVINQGSFYGKARDGSSMIVLRTCTTRSSGAILPEPKRTRFGFLGVVCSVVVGLLIGATLSKMMANFLEEKELFVPSDDDDDDDD